MKEVRLKVYILYYSISIKLRKRKNYLEIKHISDFHGLLEKSWLQRGGPVAYLGEEGLTELFVVLIMVVVRDLLCICQNPQTSTVKRNVSFTLYAL